MYVAKSFEIILKEHEIDPIDYDEVMNNMDVHIWLGAIEVELESMHYNKVWELILKR